MKQDRSYRPPPNPAPYSESLGAPPKSHVQEGQPAPTGRLVAGQRTGGPPAPRVTTPGMPRIKRPVAS
jgi:hypothetical protein